MVKCLISMMKVGISLVFIIMLGCSDHKGPRLQKFLLKGNLSSKEGNTDHAIYYFEQALKLDPCFVDALNNLGTINFGQKRLTEALNLYNRAIACRPNFLPAYFNRANTFYELNEYFSAERDVRRIIEQKPDTAVAYFMQGLISTKMHNYPAAVTAFDKAIRIDSRNVEYRVNRGIVYYYLHQLGSAEIDLAIAAGLNPDEPNIYNTQAMIEISRGNHDKALGRIQKSLHLSPNQPYFLNNRGFIFLMQNRLPEALSDIDRSIQLDPNNGWSYRNKGIYHLLSGNYEDAIRLLKQGLSMDSFIEKIHFYLGMAYWKNNQKREACEQFRMSERMGDRMATVDIMKACK